MLRKNPQFLIKAWSIRLNTFYSRLESLKSYHMRRPYLITFDLEGAESTDYERVENAIKDSGDGLWPCIDNTFITFYDGTAKEFLNSLKVLLGDGVEMIIIEVARNYATYGLSEECEEWLETQL